MAHASGILGAGDASQDGHVVLIFIAPLEFMPIGKMMGSIYAGRSVGAYPFHFLLEKFLISLRIPWDAKL
jgi:hypothetical protein